MANLKVINGKITTDTNGLVLNSSNNVASGDDSQAEGNATTASGLCSHAGGNSTVASGELSIASGLGAKTPNLNEFGRAYPISITNLGQYGFVNFVGTSTSNTLNQRLYLDAGSSNFSIPSNSAFALEMHFLCRNTSTGASKYLVLRGLVKNVAGNTTVVGTDSGTIVAEDASMSTVLCNLLVDNITDTVYAAVTGIAATTIEYNVRVDYTMIKPI